MKNQVLTIEQMRELIDMGVDVSKSSMCWLIPKHKGDILLHIRDERDEWEYIEKTFTSCPAFTLQDILEMLPPTLEFQNVYGNTHFEYIEFWGDGWNQMAVVDPLHPSSPRITTSNISPLRAAFDMLKWCKQNNYI